ncbi:MAG: tRNA (adenosine(37)-N6)-dimethylallyltransferase MiaA [Actinomycetales bacterium]
MPVPLITIVGPTATGKSDLGVELALRLNGEVVNADASQLYRGMDVGTAKLPLAERRGVVHHQLDVLTVTQTASVAAYQAAARADIESIMARGHTPILVGGSGLYIKAVIDPLEFPGTDPRVRAAVESRAAQIGPRALHAELAAVDPDAARSIEPSNLRRVVRALEVVELTGRPFSATLPGPDYLRPTVQVGLSRPREDLDESIATRVHTMMEAGFLAEVESLIDAGLREGRTASRALGYAQLLEVLAGGMTVDEAVRRTIAATRAFARRQVKWFRRDPRITWLDVDAAGGVGPLADSAEQVLRGS